jgi:hypothetical protein
MNEIPVPAAGLGVGERRITYRPIEKAAHALKLDAPRTGA